MKKAKMGDGRSLALLLLRCPEAKGIALDFSPAMIARASERFRGDDRVRVIEHDLGQPLPDLGTHDAVCSSFDIHHVSHERKRSLYGELIWLREIGFKDVDCLWEWRELALLAGVRPTA